MLIFEMSKSYTNFHMMGIGHFDAYIGMKVSIYVNLWSIFYFFGSSLQARVVQVIWQK